MLEKYPLVGRITVSKENVLMEGRCYQGAASSANKTYTANKHSAESGM